MRFQPGFVPPEILREPAYWFAFRGDKLLVRLEERSASVPLAVGLGEYSLVPVRTRYLGVQMLGDEKDVHCYGAELPADAADPDGMSFVGLRQLFGLLDDGFFRLGGFASQIMEWEQTHQYCGRCGSAAVDDPEDRAKLCPRCGLKSFPRVAPAVIVAVTKGDCILLARAKRFPVKLYSVIAGFVEPGETLEECLVREVGEETGVDVGGLRYFGSQPWPFPHSLMIAFTARWRGGDIRIDEREIVDAGWFKAGELPPIPDKVSIARRLIDWFVDTRGETAPPEGAAPSVTPP
jgi:NAD+ diphosphatase